MRSVLTTSEKVKQEYLTPSLTTSKCPYKGSAKYYNAVIEGNEYKDVV